MLGFNSSISGAPAGGTVFGNILRGIGNSLFGGSVGTGGTPATTATQQNNQSFWKNVGAGLAGSIATIFAGLLSKDSDGAVQNPDGILTSGATPYYPMASAQIWSMVFPVAMIVGVFYGVKALFFSGKKRR